LPAAAIAKLAAAGKDGYFEASYAVDGVGAEDLKDALILARSHTGKGL